MKTLTQLKAHISNLARKSGVKPEVLYRHYMLERFLKRLSLSRYKSNFVLKGGLLIAYVVGIESRGTMDLDGTIRNYPVTEDKLREMLADIIAVPADDSIAFVLNKIEPIMLEHSYECLRVNMTATFENMRVPVKLDISTGDVITPRPVEFRHKLMFSEEQIEILAYNLETVLAEKVEAIISRNITGTRMRDFYDVFILTKLQKDNINFDLWKTALQATSERRNTAKIIENAARIMVDIKASDDLQKLWQSYTANYDYAKDVNWEDVCVALDEILLHYLR